MTTPLSMSKTFGLLLQATALVLYASIIVFLWTRYMEQPFLYFQNRPFPASEKVYAGEPIPLLMERCSAANQTRTYLSTHSLRNEATQQSEVLPDVTVPVEPGCKRVVTRIIVIPPGTPPGRYALWGVAVVNGTMHAYRVPWTSETFEVLPPPTKGSPRPPEAPRARPTTTAAPSRVTAMLRFLNLEGESYAPANHPYQTALTR